jgi:hypothetical protein
MIRLMIRLMKRFIVFASCKIIMINDEIEDKIDEKIYCIRKL